MLTLENPLLDNDLFQSGNIHVFPIHLMAGIYGSLLINAKGLILMIIKININAGYIGMNYVYVDNIGNKENIEDMLRTEIIH
jgi:hypothetical protein